MSTLINPHDTRTLIAEALSTTNRIIYMPDRGTIVPRSAVRGLRTAEQNRVLRLFPGRYREGRLGGGLIEIGAVVGPNVFTALGTIIEATAAVGGNVRIEDTAEVGGRCYGDCIIKDDARIAQGDKIHGHATISGEAYIGDGGDIGGHVNVGGATWVGENVRLGGGGTLTLNPEYTRRGYQVTNFHYIIPSNLTISEISQFADIENLYRRQR